MRHTALSTEPEKTGGIRMTATQQVETEWLTFDSEGATIPGYLARPAGPGPWPGIVMIHENPGLTEHRQEVTRDLAAEGYVVLTPNLYARIGGNAPDDEDEHARHLKVGLAVPDEQVHQDLMAGCGVLQRRSDVDRQRMGLIGFCMGGAKGLYTACKSDAYRCLVDFYGPTEQSAERYGIGRSLLPLVKDLSCPIQFHVGDRDTTCSPEQAEALRQELARHGKIAECYTYAGAQHAFHGEGPRHHEPSATVAWGRALEFLRRYLGE